MKIRTILKLNVFVTLAVLLISITGIITIKIRLSKLYHSLKHIEQAQLDLALLSDLSMEYVLFKNPRASFQWVVKHHQMEQTILNLKDTDIGHEEYEQLEKQYYALRSSFTELSHSSVTETSYDYFVSNFFLINVEVRATAKRLRHLIDHKHVFYSKLVHAAFISVVALLSLIIMFWVLMLHRKMMLPLSDMEEYVNSVTQGNFILDIPDLKEDEIGHLIESFSEMAKRVDFRERELIDLNSSLLKKNKELDEFTYIASHDLQEPLRKLISFSSLLEKDIGNDLNDNAKMDIEYIVDAASRMQRLIQDLLSFSRTGRSELDINTVNLQDTVDKVLVLMNDRINQTNAKIIKTELPNIIGDPILISLVFQNLIQNALKFSNKEQPVIEITCEHIDDKYILGVKDNGIGIKEEYRQQIFQPFKRLHSRYEYPGTGIGLAICQKIVEKHNGKIWVESEENLYTHFKFTINEMKEIK